MLSRTSLRTHTGSYQTIPPTAPAGLQCLQSLLSEEDAAVPSRPRLSQLLAPDFRDLENGKERSKSREDVITQLVSRGSRYSKYQTDLAQAWCITNTDKTQTVLFEGIRFVVFVGDSEWVRIPVSGRLEVRVPKGAVKGEVVLRKMTMDLSAYWRRKEELASSGQLVSPVSVAYPSGAVELPAYGAVPPVGGEYKYAPYQPPVPTPSPRLSAHAPLQQPVRPPWQQQQSQQEKDGRKPPMGHEQNRVSRFVPPLNDPRPGTFVPHPREERNMESEVI